LVSLAYHSREKSKGKDEREIKSKVETIHERGNSRN
jgi:hypothetical protein